MFDSAGHPHQQFCSRRCAGKSRAGQPTAQHGAKLGQRPWNKGIAWHHAPPTVVTRARISESKRNRPGERVTPEHNRQRKTSEYGRWRREVFQRDDYTCQFCGDRGAKGHRVRLHADHILPFATHPDLRLDVANGRTLCEDCHRRTPTYGYGGAAAEVERNRERGQLALALNLTGQKAERVHD